MLTSKNETSRYGRATPPVVADNFSQLPPESVEADAVQDSDPWPVLSTPMLCARGMPPCAAAVKLSPVCDSRSTRCGLVITIVTAIDATGSEVLVAAIAT